MVRVTMRTAGLTFLLLLALAAPASAGTSNCVAPPGTAAIEEYCETIPSANGNGGGGAHAQQPVDRSTTRALRAQGADGKALVTLLASDGSAQAGAASGSSTKPRAGTHRQHTAGRVKSASAAQDEPSQNPLRAVTSAVESGPTLGGGLIWALLGITALMVAAGWLRLRGRRT